MSSKKRMEKMRSSYQAGNPFKLPPIEPINPFEFDESGSSFKHYPGHHPVNEDGEFFLPCFVNNNCFLSTF